MDSNLRNKLIEIIFDKFLIGLLIVVAVASINNIVNRGLEKYKLIEAQRVADTSDVVKASSELWAKAYEYEYILNTKDGHRSMLSFYRTGWGSTPKIEEVEKKIAEIEQLREEKLKELFKSISDKRFIIGEQLTSIFLDYVGLIQGKANYEERLHNYMDKKESFDFPKEHIEREITELLNLIEVLDKEIPARRLSALSVREYTI